MLINDYGFRTLVISSPCSLTCGDGRVIVGNGGECAVPISQLRTLLINTNNVTISSALLNELAKNNVHSVFCDEKHNPSFEIAAFSTNNDAAGKILDQGEWNSELKLEVWKQIVKLKIIGQRSLLKQLGVSVPEGMLDLENTVTPGDFKNCEALAARLYFRALFGRWFIRHASDEINSALNYGYILILNMFNRILSMHGYHTAIGIKHCSRQNRFNLSCDLMEPFRPFIDKIVFENREKPFDWKYKKILIESLDNPVVYGNREMKIPDACELYSLDALKTLYSAKNEIKELCLD